MNISFWTKSIPLLVISLLMYSTCYANENIFQQAKGFQREGRFNEAISGFKSYLTQSVSEENLTDEQVQQYSEALLQLMNTYQSKGEPETCISTLQEVFKLSPVMHTQCLRDYYSVLGYALSRTENMKEAEATMLKALSLPLYHATPERYFRDYAYAAAVFYSNPDYQSEVITWCNEALSQADLSENTSGKQWVTAMLGSHYKRYGHLNKALDLFLQSKDEAQARKDDLGVLNSLQALVDMFLYWGIPEYANVYATEAIKIEQTMSTVNPMVSAQAYINKGRALHKLGELDSVSAYVDKARQICQPLPYNSGMVDVNLFHGTFLTEKGGDSLDAGIEELKQVTSQGTNVNCARAYHQLAQAYLKTENIEAADMMLDSMYMLLTKNQLQLYIDIDYDPILNYYLNKRNYAKVEQYVRIMLQEQKAVNEKSLSYNLVESIVDLQTEQKRKELMISQLQHANKSLWLLIYIAISIIIMSGIVFYLIKQKKQHKIQLKQADEKLSSLVQQIDILNAEEEMRAQEIKDFLENKNNRHELETLTPTILQTDGESKFRQYFELLYPLFLPRIRERVPSITRREELLCMLIVLKLDNKRISDLMAIAPRSVLMLRHRFRQKIGMTTDLSLENFIEETLETNND